MSISSPLTGGGEQSEGGTLNLEENRHISSLRLGRWPFLFVLCFLFVALFRCDAAGTFRIATYNLENYLAQDTNGRKAKSPEARTKIRESIKALNADVIALQEIGPTATLLELQSSLRSEGVNYPYSEFVTGFDTNIFVAVLSKFPFSARHSHTNEHYLLNGRRLQMSRGIAEVEIRVNARYTFTLFSAHLKSKRPVGVANEADMREEEAKLLRSIIDAHLKSNPNANFVVMGDFNDTRDSKPVRTLIGRGKSRLVDTRPAERNGDTLHSGIPGHSPRNITWTHYYGLEDTYSRIDYILLSPGMAHEWNPSASYVLAQPNWGLASDHRPLVVAFTAEDR